MASPARRRVLAAVSARFVGGLAGLDTRPELVGLLDTLEDVDGPTVDDAATDALRRAIAAPRNQAPGLDAMAAKVLHLASNPDSRLAAMDATWHAHMLLPDDRRAAFHAAALRLLGASAEPDHPE